MGILIKRKLEYLNDCQPVLSSNIGEKGVRDPFILRSAEGDKFFMIATDLRIASGKGWDAAQTAGSKSIIVWDSNDLVNWLFSRLYQKETWFCYTYNKRRIQRSKGKMG